jgi:hypothetical protein
MKRSRADYSNERKSSSTRMIGQAILALLEQTEISNFVLLSIHPRLGETSVAGVLRSLILNPGEMLIRRWNWKASLFSSLMRGLLFFTMNAAAGWRAAVAAGAVEFLYRSVTAGFYGALTQSFRCAEPKWQATLAVILLLPVCSHSVELLLHWWRGTPRLAASIAASAGMTVLSTAFNLYAMRRGVLVVGAGGRSLASDVRGLPRLISGFLLAGPISVWRFLARRHSPESL